MKPPAFTRWKLLAAAVLLATVAVTAAYWVLQWQENWVDYRKFFSLGIPRGRDAPCYVVAGKRTRDIAGGIFFMHCLAPRRQWELMRFDCDAWRLDKRLSLPDQFDDTDAALSFVDGKGENCFIIPVKAGGEASSFLHFNAATGKTAWYEGFGKSVVRARPFGNEAWVMLQDPKTGYGSLVTVSLQDGSRRQIGSSDLKGGIGEIIGCSMDVSYDEPLYFSATFSNGATTRTLAYCQGRPGGEIRAISSFPPGRLASPDQRYPYPMTLVGANMRGCYDLYAGTLTSWPSISAVGVLLLGPKIDDSALRDKKRLARMPLSDEVSSWPWFVSPDGKYVLYTQESQIPYPTEGLIAINMASGKQAPILLHWTHGHYGFLDLFWTSSSPAGAK